MSGESTLPPFADPAAVVPGPSDDARKLAYFPKGVDLNSLPRIVREANAIRTASGHEKTWWRRLLYLRPDNHVDRITDLVIDDYPTDFAVAYSYWPDFFAQLMYSGWLITGDATKRRDDGTFEVEWLLPKLHQVRCLLDDWSLFKVRASTVKRSSHYRLTINRDPDATVWHIVEQHGDSWLYPKLRAAYLALLRSNSSRNTGHVWSVELWREATPSELAEQEALAAELAKEGKTKPDPPVFDAPKYRTEGDYVFKIKDTTAPSRVHSLAYPGYVLVAGDLGATVGSSYVSLTGWRRNGEDGAGTVLLATLGRLLAKKGITVWDFGMPMDYKKDLGARKVARREFVHILHSIRDDEGIWLGFPDGESRSAKDIIKEGEEVCKNAKQVAAALSSGDYNGDEEDEDEDASNEETADDATKSAAAIEAALATAAKALASTAGSGKTAEMDAAVNQAVAAALAAMSGDVPSASTDDTTGEENKVGAEDTSKPRGETAGEGQLSKNEQKRRAKAAKKAEYKAAAAAARAATDAARVAAKAGMSNSNQEPATLDST